MISKQLTGLKAMTTCAHCNTQPVGDSCSHCGNIVKLKRIDGHYISYELQHLLHFDAGFLYTVKELLIRPGKTVRSFLFENREKYAKPIVFAIFSALVFTIIMSLIKVNYVLFSISEIEKHSDLFNTIEINKWTQSHLGYVTLIMSAFVALMLSLFFRKTKFNIIEIAVLMCYVSGEAVLLLGLIILFAKALSSSLLVAVALLVYFAYPVWAIGQFFGEKKITNYVKALISYFLGICLYVQALLLIAYCYKQAV